MPLDVNAAQNLLKTPDNCTTILPACRASFIFVILSVVVVITSVVILSTEIVIWDDVKGRKDSR